MRIERPLRLVRRGATAIVLAGGVACATACTALLNLQTQQCSVDGDCLAFGDAYRCVASSCVRASTADGVSGDAGADAPRCTTNAECIDQSFGEPYVCDKATGACTALKLGDACPFVAPNGAASNDLRSDNVVVVAAFMPLRGGAPLAGPLPLAYQLALQEIHNAGGLSGGPGGPRRPLAAVFCESDPAIVEQGVAHVIRTLHVPAMISLFSQTDMTRFIQDYAVPADVFTLNPQDTTEALENADVNRLAWHLLGTPEDIATAYRPLLSRVEPYARSLHGKGSSSPIKVALVTSDSPTENAIAAVLKDASKGITWNGADLPHNDGAGAFLSMKIPSIETDPTSTYGGAVDQLAAFHPDVVIALTAGELGQIVAPLEAKMRADSPSAPLPVWILSTRNDQDPNVLAYLANATVESSTDKLARFLGVQYAGSADPAQRDAWLSRMKDAYPQVNPLTYRDKENFYDAVYWLAYGLYAAGPGAPVNGDSFKNGVRNLLSGPKVYPGTVQSIADAFLALATAGNGTFVGALGPPSINPATGAQMSVGSVYCYTPPGSSVAPKYDVLRFDAQTGALDATTNDLCFVF